MTNVCIVRHGETDWNVLGKIQGKTDIALNQNGIRQSEECREFLKLSQWDLMITSPLKRAKQTAMIINEELNLPLFEMEEFMERSFGDAEGKTLAERQALYPDGEYPNQEERNKFHHRVMTGLTKIHQRFQDSQVLLIAHGAVINAILANLSNEEIGFEETRLVNACINNIFYHEEQWMINNFNQTSHLSRV
ncbi:histidine phosphatase family protein [Cytobacillus sp. Hz8]|uniref:histidine phosphatase family protein n=1 Tax=Cytobacillus sp. Hz8 TaxID=3347168 RepID=UPI0035E37C23